MIKKILFFTFATCIFVFSLTATAEQPSYNYFDVSYRKSTESTFVELQGPSIEASHLFSPNWFIQGGFYDGRNTDGLPEFNLSSLNFDLTRWNIGVGYTNTLFKHSSWHTTLGYVDQALHIDNSLSDFENSSSQNLDGWNISIGIRSAITDRFEVGAQAVFETLDGSILQTSPSGIITIVEANRGAPIENDRYSIGAYTLFKLTPKLSLKAAIDYNDNHYSSSTFRATTQSPDIFRFNSNSTSYTLGLRWNFS